MGLSGAEKRRKRKGGSPTGGPGKHGLFKQPVRSRRGYLAPTILERHLTYAGRLGQTRPNYSGRPSG